MPPETPTTAPEQAASYLAPTLLIGLGGSGKDVLLRVRRMFYERHGRRTVTGPVKILPQLQVAAVNRVQIVPPAAVLYVGLTSSPDGNDAYFVTYPKDANIASLYRVPLSGGVPVKILEKLSRMNDWSNEG